ncbi:hypothetical protein B0T17DRAFT_510287 [Bombardia bombarda]|uniref:DUF6594 domain-containing protein n=1 Tax=Bombardia bombarda TaxID=252184 RepID=A0AA39WHY0_9PEZI|nr:hypothetical protein B0T17DRAFT_510287 [Bombardia bombarda]
MATEDKAPRKQEPLTPELQQQEPVEPRVTQDQAYKKSWKYIGYRHFSRFMSLHENFGQVRLFRTLNSRVLLAMQDYISELETKLDKMEDEMSKVSGPDLHNGSFRQETSAERMKLIWEIQKRLKAYNEYILTYSQLSKRRPVYPIDTQSVRNYLDSWPNAIKEEETAYLDHKDDLVYISERTDSFIGRRFRPGPSWATTGAIRSRRHRRSRVADDDDTTAFVMDGTFIHDAGKVEELYQWAFVILGFAMLISPLWILVFVTAQIPRLAIMTCFILAFLGLVSFVTTARPFETLAATAAYAAVLVVFLQAQGP